MILQQKIQIKKTCIIFFLLISSVTAFGQYNELTVVEIKAEAVRILKKTTLKQAKKALKSEPITVTSNVSERSAGGIHDFYSEGDYWWQNPDDLDGPYIRRDGKTNPDNFTAHRLAMVRFSKLVGSLTSAYLITENSKYAEQVRKHLAAWFITDKTRMNPSLLYAQAIKGRVTGRGIGIIDMIQMIEVAQSVIVLERKNAIPAAELKAIKSWFADYLEWITTHPYGIDERDTKNNHATCWVMQVAAFAKLTNNQQLLDYCSNRFREVLLPNQLAKDGSFPLEMERTKPYGYALFNLDAMTTVCQILSFNNTSLWDFTTSNGKNIQSAIEFMHPFVEDKTTWEPPPDVMYYDEWPVAHPFLLFGSTQFKNKDWFKTWARLEHFPETQEVIRNLPIRNPLIWVLD
ncbi:MAG: hypothetical protein ACI9V1_002018 [Spirosomataceae bacterium]|jgi:hypothetical protein